MLVIKLKKNFLQKSSKQILSLSLISVMGVHVWDICLTHIAEVCPILALELIQVQLVIVLQRETKCSRLGPIWPSPVTFAARWGLTFPFSSKHLSDRSCDNIYWFKRTEGEGTPFNMQSTKMWLNIIEVEKNTLNVKQAFTVLFSLISREKVNRNRKANNIKEVTCKLKKSLNNQRKVSCRDGTLTMSTSFFSSSISFSFFFPFPFFLPACSEVAASSYCSRPSWRHGKERSIRWGSYLVLSRMHITALSTNKGSHYWVTCSSRNGLLPQVSAGTLVGLWKLTRFY